MIVLLCPIAMTPIEQPLLMDKKETRRGQRGSEKKKSKGAEKGTPTPSISY